MYTAKEISSEKRRVCCQPSMAQKVKVAGNRIAGRKTHLFSTTTSKFTVQRSAFSSLSLSVFQWGSLDHIHNANVKGSVKASHELLGRPRNMPLALLPTHIHVIRFLHSGLLFTTIRKAYHHRLASLRTDILKKQIKFVAPRLALLLLPHGRLFRACRPDSAVMKNTSFCNYCVDTSVAAFKKPDRLL